MEKGQENSKRADGRLVEHDSHKVQRAGIDIKPVNKLASANSNAKSADDTSGRKRELYWMISIVKDTNYLKITDF